MAATILIEIAGVLIVVFALQWEPDCPPQLRLAGSQSHQALIEFCEMLSDRVLSQKPQDMEAAFRAFAARSD